MLALRYRALRIPTRCCQPTDREPTLASGSISKPNCSPSLRIRTCAARRSRKIGFDIGSVPRGGVLAPAGAAGEEDRVRHRRVAEEDVLGHREDRDQHEMLMDHADPSVDRIARVVDLD